MPFTRGTRVSATLEKVLSLPDMLSQLVDANTLCEIGQAYGRQMPGEYAINKLVDLLLENATGSQGCAKASPTEIHSCLTQHIQAEFQAGQTLLLEGWVLAVSEARQAALFALLHS